MTASALTALDTETHLVQSGLLTPPIVCGSFCDSWGYSLLDKHATLEKLRRLLESEDSLAGANIAYDFGCAAAADPKLLPLIFDKYEKGQIIDILIAQTLDAIARGLLRDDTGKKMLVDPRTGGPLLNADGKRAYAYNLENVTDLCLGRKDAKKNDKWRLSYALLESLPIEQWPPEAKQYPLDDARNTYDVAVHQLANHRNLHDMSYQAYAAWCLHLGSVWGMRADPSRVRELRMVVDKRHADAVANFIAAGMVRPDGTKDTTQIRARVTTAYLGKPPTTAKGAVATDKDTMAESGDELLEAFGGFGGNNKIRETYLPFLEEAALTPVNISPNVLVSTGRTSYKGKIQTIPREGGVRECIIPSRGRVLCSVDYSAIEMCTLAEVCYELLGFSDIGDLINRTKDPGSLHTALAARMAGREDDPTFFKAALDKSAPESFTRYAAKAGNFGFPGMMGEIKFVKAKRREGIKLCTATKRAERCGVTKTLEWKGRPCDSPTCVACLETSAWIKAGFVGMWREMRPYWNKITFLLDSGGGEITQLVSGRVRGGCSGPQAANTLFQGLAADGAKRALRLITRESYTDRNSPLWGSRLLVFAHDETLMEHREEVAHEAAYRQSELMIQGMKEVVKRVHIVAEPALMRSWTKKAEAVFDSKGRLIPWEDRTQKPQA